MASMSARLMIVRRLCLSQRQPSHSTVFTVTVRNSSKQTSAQKDELIRVDDNLSLRLAQHSHQPPGRRPLVLIYAWLGAKTSHLNKFSDFYLGKGFDVLYIRIRISQFLWPLSTHRMVSKVADFITEEERRHQPILVHGFSVGGYVYGETLVKFKSQPDRLSSMRDRVKGQIFDSTVTADRTATGIAKTVAGNVLLEKIIHFTVMTYLTLFNHWVTKYYWISSEAYHSNPLRSPSLLLYSTKDVFTSHEAIETMKRVWISNGYPVYHKCWDDSPHVEHFRYHPDEYMAMVDKFLTAIELQPPDTSTSTDRIDDSDQNK